MMPAQEVAPEVSILTSFLGLIAVLSLSRTDPLRSIFDLSENFGSAEIRSPDRWVRSANASSLLCRQYQQAKNNINIDSNNRPNNNNNNCDNSKSPRVLPTLPALPKREQLCSFVQKPIVQESRI